MLADLEGLDHHVDRFLAVGGKKRNPSGIALIHDIAVVVPDVDRTGYRTIPDHHDHRKPHRRNDGENLLHEQQTLGARGGECTRAGAGGAAAGADGGMFGFHTDKFRIQSSLGYNVRQMFRHMRVGGDGIGRNDVRSAQGRRLGRGDSDFHTDSFTHSQSSSLTMTIAFGQHSWAQMPHPLQ